MASRGRSGKLYRLFTLWDHAGSEDVSVTGWGMLFGISIAMFVSLVGWGSDYFGWADPDGKIQLAIITTFIMGVICGYKTKG